MIACILFKCCGIVHQHPYQHPCYIYSNPSQSLQFPFITNLLDEQYSSNIYLVSGKRLQKIRRQPHTLANNNNVYYRKLFSFPFFFLGGGGWIGGAN